MSDSKPDLSVFALTDPRPFVRYSPPMIAPQPTRSDKVRDVWADALRFLQWATEPHDAMKSLMITTTRWSAESMRNDPQIGLGEWPTECSTADFNDAVHRATECFGKPSHHLTATQAKSNGLEDQRFWHVPVDRAEEVFDFLDGVSACTVGEFAPVNATCSSMFRLRDLESGVVFPGQEWRHYPGKSRLEVHLQRRSRASLSLILPFAEPNSPTADYVVALQEYAPVWIDPRYFDYMTVRSDGLGHSRLRLPASWIGVTPDGALRLDPSRSGLTPAEINLPTNAEMAAEDPKRDDTAFHAHFATVLTALRRHTIAAMVIRGDSDLASHVVQMAAERLGIPVHDVSTGVFPESSLRLADQLRDVIADVSGSPAVIAVDFPWYSTPEENDVVIPHAATRVLDGVAIPPTVRLVVMAPFAAVGEEARAATERVALVRDDGFGTPQQRQFLARQEARTGYREMTIEFLAPLDGMRQTKSGI